MAEGSEFMAPSRRRVSGFILPSRRRLGVIFPSRFRVYPPKPVQNLWSQAAAGFPGLSYQAATGLGGAGAWMWGSGFTGIPRP